MTYGLELLRAIGSDLDSGRAPRVQSRGVIWPSTIPRDSSTDSANSKKGVIELGESHEGPSLEAGSKGPTAGPREGPAVAHTGRPGSTAATAPEQRRSPLIHAPVMAPRSRVDAERLAQVLGAHAAHDIHVLIEEYPQFSVRVDDQVVWLTGIVEPVTGLTDKATLLVAIPMHICIPVRIWGWWHVGVWIGPRHTYRDGSACIFEPGDSFGSWSRSAPLLPLMDMAVAWVAKHLHLLYFGTWPGRQHIHTIVERLEFNHPDELCGCGSDVAYAACHGPGDVSATLGDIQRELGDIPIAVARHVIHSRHLPRRAQEFRAAAIARVAVRRNAS